MEEIIAKITTIMEEVKPGFDCAGKIGLVDNGYLDSFDVITLVAELNEAFDIDIPVEAIVPENFSSLETIAELVSAQLED